MKSDNFNKSVGSRIYQAMGEMTQDELAKKCKFPRPTLTNYISGSRSVPLDKLVAIADVLGVSTDYLLGRTEIKTTNAELQSVCNYTGLSEKAVDNIAGCVSEAFVPFNTLVESDESFRNFIIALYGVWSAVDRANDRLSLAKNGSLSKLKNLSGNDDMIEFQNQIAKQHLAMLEQSRHDIRFSLFEMSDAITDICKKMFNTDSITGEITSVIGEMEEYYYNEILDDEELAELCAQRTLQLKSLAKEMHKAFDKE